MAVSAGEMRFAVVRLRSVEISRGPVERCVAKGSVSRSASACLPAREQVIQHDRACLPDKSTGVPRLQEIAG